MNDSIGNTSKKIFFYCSHILSINHDNIYIVFLGIINYRFFDCIRYLDELFFTFTPTFLIKGSIVLSTSISACRFASSSPPRSFSFILPPGTPRPGSIKCITVNSASRALPRDNEYAKIFLYTQIYQLASISFLLLLRPLYPHFCPSMRLKCCCL